MAELGVLLEAKAVHTGRSARNHLLALAQTNGISRQRVDEVIDIVGLQQVAGKRVGGFSLGMGQRLGVASALLGNPQTVVLDEPVNGLDPEGVLWMRTMLKDLAADGHTVFVSSHLMSEMAQTATRLVVVGRGRLIADTTVDEFIAQASHHAVTVRTPETARLRELLLGPDVTVTTAQPDVLQIDGLTAEHIGTIAWQHQVPIFELTVQQASLEEAFMTLTSDSVEYRSTDNTGTATTHRGGGGMTTATLTPIRHRRRHPAAGHPGPGPAVRMDQVPLPAVDRLHPADRRRADDRSRAPCSRRSPPASRPDSSRAPPRSPPH